MAQWFRFHADALNNPKVQKLNGDLFKSWINILSMTCKCDGRVTSHGDASFYLRMSQGDYEVTIDALVDAELIIKSEEGIVPYGWDERQYKSDSSADRTRKYRERKRAEKEKVKQQGDSKCDVTVTPPDTDTDTDTDIKKNKQKKFNFKNSLIGLGADKQLADDWIAVRKTKKATNTRTALDRFLLQVEKSNLTINQVLEKCNELSWSGFQAEWLKNLEAKSNDANKPRAGQNNSGYSVSNSRHITAEDIIESARNSPHVYKQSGDAVQYDD